MTEYLSASGSEYSHSCQTYGSAMAFTLSWLQISSLYLIRHLWPQRHRVRPRPHKFFWPQPRPCGIWPQPWPRTLLASLTSLVVIASLHLLHGTAVFLSLVVSKVIWSKGLVFSCLFDAFELAYKEPCHCCRFLFNSSRSSVVCCCDSKTYKSCSFMNFSDVTWGGWGTAKSYIRLLSDLQ